LPYRQEYFIRLLCTHEEPQMTDLVFKNIEALANGEMQTCTICIGYGTVECDGAKVKTKYINLRELGKNGAMRNVFLSYGLGMLLLSSLFVSCKKDKRISDVRKIISDWTGKQIKFPDGIPCIATGAKANYIPLSNPSYKILMHANTFVKYAITIFQLGKNNLDKFGVCGLCSTSCRCRIHYIYISQCKD
jgi:hypothetical protein